MAVRSFLSLFILSLLGSSLASIPRNERAFVPTTVVEKQISVLRGGARGDGPFDPATMSKVLSGVYMAQGVYMSLVPRKSTVMYNIRGNSALMNHLVEITGGLVLGLGIATYALAIKGTTVRTALGSSLVGSSLIMIKALLDDTPRRLGYGTELQAVLTVLFTAAAYGGLERTDWAENAMRISAVVRCIMGAFGGLATRAYADAWRLNRGITSMEMLQVQILSWWNLAWGVMAYSLLDGGRVYRAIGYAATVLLAMTLKLTFMTKEVEQNNISKEIMYAWIATLAVSVYAMLG